jgi:hypothetical protein
MCGQCIYTLMRVMRQSRLRTGFLCTMRNLDLAPLLYLLTFNIRKLYNLQICDHCDHKASKF